MQHTATPTNDIMAAKQQRREPEKNKYLRAAMTIVFVAGSFASIAYLYYSGLPAWISVVQSPRVFLYRNPMQLPNFPAFKSA